MRISFLRFFTGILIAIILGACASSKQPLTTELTTIEYDLLYTLPREPLSFNNDVLPVLEKRCIACHGCYDAPCQLKLSSAEGIDRGSNKNKVYDGSRFFEAEPTRLFIDAMTTAEWRNKDFTSVLYEKNKGESNDPVKNLKNSVLYRMLRLKQLQPQARTGMLDTSFDLSLDRKQSCPTLEEFDSYASDHPKGGMPYAMPNLPRNEYKKLVYWIAQGAPTETDLTPSKKVAKQITQWEKLLNGNSKKETLFSRYIYEHLFQAHLHFKDSGQREFYRLVRSTTPPGDKVDVIATRRPYDGANGRIFYRITRHQGSIVEKTHNVYELSNQRMQRYKELFLDADYKIDELPSYEPTVASNPIKAFADIPVKSRYKFLLDDAKFFIEGFIKGPVCRGQIALGVIEDQFWVAFLDPDAPIASSDNAFLKANADTLALPSELGNTFRIFSANHHYKSLFRDYSTNVSKKASSAKTIDLSKAMTYLWDGDGKTNKNAALTIFRHFDDASVDFGWHGNYPETAWLIDYTVLERIHYLLVAGFDVYGNVGHQVDTRLYMDILREEGENYFLAFLPVAKRHQLINDWYKGLREKNKSNENDLPWLNDELVKGYKTNDEQRELYKAIQHRLGAMAGNGDFINRCDDNKCTPPDDKNILRVDTAMRDALKMDGRVDEYSPDLTFLRVLMGGKPENDRAYSIIYNKAYITVSNILQSEKSGDPRDYKFDSQTILPWLEGSYPNFFYVVELDDIETFVKQYNAISTAKDYEIFIMRFGIRRTNEDFWRHADWFNEQHKRNKPVLSGIFDLNRYQNR
jgi:hypothetical protein